VSGGGVTTTTGGGSATPTTVTALADLQNAVKGTNAAVVYVKGVMAAGSVSIGSNKTIAGLCGAEIHGHVGMSGSTNVIVRNIKIVGYAVGNCALDPSYDSSVGCSSGEDAISVGNNAHHIWFDHCDISDGTDGNLDINNGSDLVTVSWTKFHYTPRTDNSGSDSTGGAGHRYSNLVGGGDNISGDVGKLNVTWHHDWWADNVMERMPRVRYGKNHVLNSLYTCAGDNYCVRAGMDAQILVESNVFSGVKTPQQFNSTADQSTAYITATNNLYTNCSGTQATGGGGTPFTTPPYSYTADATAGLQAAIQSGAGPK
jgi:pectate lyase